MYQETVKTPTKCSHNLWVIKVNKKPEITSVCGILYICNKISITKQLVDMSHVQLFWFPFNVPCKQNINLTEVFHIKSPRAAFLPTVSFEIFTAVFSSWIFIFPPVHWLKKSDHSSLGFREMLLSLERSSKWSGVIG